MEGFMAYDISDDVLLHLDQGQIQVFKLGGAPKVHVNK